MVFEQVITKKTFEVGLQEIPPEVKAALDARDVSVDELGMEARREPQNRHVDFRGKKVEFKMVGKDISVMVEDASGKSDKYSITEGGLVIKEGKNTNAFAERAAA